ncbi:hypothetical protein [Pseudogracilibacillus sp. SO30301A]|uniref:hypothetical protein n=1 Tax=Pseudogracilibacillus sp. SO30301A TaxID=3098291 RepID=UPI00300DCA08
MKRFRKSLIPLLIMLALNIPVITNAYSGSYSFSINSSVKRSTKHSLAKKKTTTTVKANTYYTGDIIKTKDSYQVSLNRGLSSYSITPTLANGSSYSISFGTVKKGDYTVNVYKTTRKTYGATVKGSGTIKQYAKVY